MRTVRDPLIERAERALAQSNALRERTAELLATQRITNDLVLTKWRLRDLL